MTDVLRFGDGWIEIDGRRIAAGDVVEIDPGGFPPLLRTGDELLFVSATRKAELEAWALKQGVPLRSRFDVWAALLEPALDTRFSAEQQKRTLEQLLRHGFTAREVEAIRARVVEPMRRWNLDSMTWEWVHLGLFDVLQVMEGRPGFEGFRREATAIALRSYLGSK